MTPVRALVLVAALAGCAAVPVPQPSPFHTSDADVGVTRIVHGSFVLSLRGTRLLVDPWFHSGFVWRQKEPLGMLPDQLPAAAAVLLTHAHADHFDETALRDIARRVPRAVGPPKLRADLVALGFREVVPLDWWDTTTLDGLRLTAVPARHAGGENGYVVEADGIRVYLAGDTRPFSELVDVATRFPEMDLAVLPVGGERVLGVLREMSPEEAAAAAKLLRAQHVVPAHYGMRGPFPFVWFAGDPVQRFTAACAANGVGRERVVPLAPGESWHWYR